MGKQTMFQFSLFFLFVLSAHLANSAPLKLTSEKAKFSTPWEKMRSSADWITWRVKQRDGDKFVIARVLKGSDETIASTTQSGAHSSAVPEEFVASRNAKLIKIGISNWKISNVKSKLISLVGKSAITAIQLEGTYVSYSKKLFCFVERQAKIDLQSVQLTSTEPQSGSCDWAKMSEYLDQFSLSN